MPYRFVSFILLLLLNTVLFSQGPLQLQGDAIEVLSRERSDLRGFLLTPQFSPYPAQIISFERQFQGNQYLYLYDLAQKKLTEVSPVTARGQQLVSVEDSIAPVQSEEVFNGQIDWRPRLDEQGRQWFAYASLGEAINPDIYIGTLEDTLYMRLTGDEAADNFPRWSPDGNSLAFISSRSGEGDIYLIDDVDQLINGISSTEIQPIQLTSTPLEERDLAWNPNPKAHLFAYAEKQHFAGRQVETFQIQVMNLLADEDEQKVLKITNDPLIHYTHPLWDPHTGRRLLFAGQSALQNSQTNLYISELEWSEDHTLQNKIMEGYKTQIYEEVYFQDRPATWLSGGRSILVQKNRPEQNYPLYTVNVNKWLNKQERAINYFEELHNEFPFISQYDVRKNNLVFTTREGEQYKIYLAQIYGPDIDPYKSPEYALNNPRENGGLPGSVYWITGGAVAAGVATYFLITELSGDEETTIQSIPIGRPPSMP